MSKSGILLLAALLICCIGQIQAVDQRSYVSGNYFLIIDNLQCGFVKSVEGGGTSAEVIQEPAGSNYFAKKHIGQPMYEDFKINIGFSMANPIYDWIAASWKMNYQRHNGAVVVCDYKLDAKSERQFSNALISETTIPACDGSSKEPAYITVKFAPEYTTSAAPRDINDDGFGKNEQKVWLPANFRLEIDGLDCTNVNKIDSFTVKQTVVTDDIGDARDYMQEPGKLEFPNLKITLSESNAASWIHWHDEFVLKGNNDESCEKNGSLIFLSPNRQTELARIRLYNLGIFKLEPEKAEANADQIKRLTAELYCERMEFDTSQTGTASQAPPAKDEVLPPDGKGEWGKTYSMRQRLPLHFTLQKANYSVEPVTIGKQCFAANANEKLLVLHFDVKNPAKTEQPVRYDSFRISAIDGMKMNRDQKQAWGVEGSNEQAALHLQPDQVISLFSVISVSAKGEPSAILVKSNRDDDGPELPYDVHGHVPALSAPFIDQSDSSGATVLEEIAAKRGVSYPYDFFAIKVENMAFTTEPLADIKLNKGEKFLVCKLTVRNHTPVEHSLRYDLIQPILTSREGELMRYKGMLLENTDRPVAQPILPGDEIRVRIFFLIAPEAALKQLILQERKSRRYIYEVPS